MKAPLILSAVLGATLSLGLFDGPLGFVFAYQPAAQAPAFTQEIDRTNKGDRQRPATSVVPKSNEPSATLPAEPTAAKERFVPTTLQECEPLASPVADAALGKWAGRCFV